MEMVPENDENVVNTVQFQFPLACPRPTWTEIANFVKQLDTDVMFMEATYRTAHNRSIYIKFVSLEAMTDSLKKNKEPKKFRYSNGKSVEVRMEIAGRNVQYVRVFDLPPELSDNSLSMVLGKYGKVECMKREKFSADLGLAHMYTGVRGVYMEIKNEIPSMIEIGNRKGRVYYEGLKDTCFLCRAVGHRKDSCPRRQHRKNREVEQTARVVSGNSVA